jgi:hypothetical protein
MRFMTIYKPADTKALECGAPPTHEEIEKMGKFIEEMAKAGVLLEADGLLSSSSGARVRLSRGKFSVTDGPFTETKELIGGYAVLEVKSKEEAIELTRKFLEIAGDGESEIRQMYDQPAYRAVEH